MPKQKKETSVYLNVSIFLMTRRLCGPSIALILRCSAQNTRYRGANKLCCNVAFSFYQKSEVYRVDYTHQRYTGTLRFSGLGSSAVQVYLYNVRNENGHVARGPNAGRQMSTTIKTKNALLLRRRKEEVPGMFDQKRC